MHVDDLPRTGPLVEVVDVLGAEEQVPSPLGKALLDGRLDLLDVLLEVDAC